MAATLRGASLVVTGTQEDDVVNVAPNATDATKLDFWNVSRIVGCVLMGFTTTLGSTFWHDGVKSLLDIQQQTGD